MVGSILMISSCPLSYSSSFVFPPITLKKPKLSIGKLNGAIEKVWRHRKSSQRDEIHDGFSRTRTRTSDC
jgi:hypothetical protein